MQYLTFGGKVNNNNARSRGTTQRYVVATTTCDRPISELVRAFLGLSCEPSCVYVRSGYAELHQHVEQKWVEKHSDVILLGIADL